MNELGYFLREQRLKADLKIIDVVELTGLSVGYLSQIETGKRKPSIQTIEKIATALGIETADILEHQKNTMIIKTNRVSNNLKLHKLIETLENANLSEQELDYIIDQAYLTLKYFQIK